MIINDKRTRENTVDKRNANKRVGFYLILIVLMTAVLATACGRQNEQAEPSVQAEASQQPESAAPSAEADPAASTETASEASGGEARSYTHEFGTTEVSGAPERIVGVYLDDFLLALGVKPLTQTMYGTRLLPYLQDQIGDLPAISTSSINLELILQEKPELILLAYPAYAQEGRYEQFAKIAPTYVFSGEDGWKDTLKKVADVIGRPEQAEAWLNEYEDKTAKARESLKQAIGDETVMFIRFTRAERIQIYGGPSNFSADVLYGDLGLQPSKLIKEFAWGEDNSAPLISAEMIPDFDADHIFITYDKPGEDDAKEFQNHPLWKNVPAVQKGNLHEVEMFHWMNDGPIANSTKVDDVLKALLK